MQKFDIFDTLMFMLLVLHIIIALSSLVFATYNLIRPSQAKQVINYGLIVSTLVSGTLMVWQSQTSLVRACGSGLVYLGIVLLMTLKAQQKLVSVEISKN